MPRARVEFTIEPFADAAPGAHVMAALDAVRARGHDPDFGPFGSTVEVPASLAGTTVRAVVDAAVRSGATRISIRVELVQEGGG
ncbi:MAG TPA: hypothetical protein VGQ20_17795 [Acidimicrobiales bacterium]|jgi:uncharacterized protein YqgV (UPF0045/DUF77 family)|nr:hypothetical protein [Acidimicrobiales bacterium]